MEIVGMRVKVSLITTEEMLNKLVSSLSYVRHKTVTENLHIVQRVHQKRLLNKPVYSSMAILEARKRLMFDFHYNFTMKKFTKKACQLSFTHTDGPVHHIITKENIHDLLFKDDVHLFHTSNYHKDHKYFLRWKRRW